MVAAEGGARVGDGEEEEVAEGEAAGVEDEEGEKKAEGVASGLGEEEGVAGKGMQL